MGEPEVVAVVPARGYEAKHVLSLAATAEARSEHPLARAILRQARHLGIAVEPATDASAVAGKGMRAVVGDRLIYLGTERYFRELGATPTALERIVTDSTPSGRTAVLVGTAVGVDGSVSVCGSIEFADRIRPAAADALRELHDAGVEHLVMLTGDNRGAARAVADAVPGIDETRSDLLPQDKVHAIRELRERYGKVAFVGDGLNDAPALAASDVGVAMGFSGTDIALEVADIALMNDDLRKLPSLIRIARKAETIIRTNIAISLLTKAAFIALAVGGWATLWMAVVADMGTSLLVIANGLRAMKS
jgi:Cd2+/Zn2+-exporting ATPase